jgi:hypothetical protein
MAGHDKSTAIDKEPTMRKMAIATQAGGLTQRLLVLVVGLLAATPVQAAEEPAATAPATAEPAAPAAGPSGKETNCTDKKDDDGDGMVDCADHDCHADAACKVGSGPENTNERCSDWFDNDGDGAIDCDDPDCEGPGIRVCKGSWTGSADGSPSAASSEEIPELKDGMGLEDLIGKGGDVDGERSDEVCADGIDNDKDGRVDCADYGCRFDPDVSVCRGNPGMRFSIVAGVENSMLDKEVKGTAQDPQYETRFARLQLRSFGPINMIPNSFYLLSLRAERTPRMTFAMFQIPLGTKGHLLNINSGGGGLSAALITSTSRQLLLEPAYYMSSSFEQGNGAAMELTGPVVESFRIAYRVFAAGGSGRSTGNIGGTYYVDDNRNYTYALGGQLTLNAIGIYNRFDSPFLYTPVPTTWAILLGGKFDQRNQERYPAWNVMSVLRKGRLFAQAETYGKYSMDFEATTMAYNIQAGVLVVPKWFLVAADFGELIAGELKNTPANLDSTLKKQLNERQFRVAAHLYFYRNIGMISALYRNREVADPVTPSLPTKENEFLLSTQFRF